LLPAKHWDETQGGGPASLGEALPLEQAGAAKAAIDAHHTIGRKSDFMAVLNRRRE
jgi:hypothetical protein